MRQVKMTRDSFHVFQATPATPEAERAGASILICAGTGCIAGGSLEIYDYIQAECQRRGMEVHISLIHEGEPEAPDEAHDLHLKKAAVTASARWGLWSTSSLWASCTSM